MKMLRILSLALFVCASALLNETMAQVSTGAGAVSITANTPATNKNLGIGNNAPVLKLDIKTNYTNDGVRVQQTGNTAASLNLEASTGRRWALFSMGSANSPATNAGNFVLFDYGGAAGTGGGYRLMVEGNTGNVGIGAGNAPPQARLDVQNGAVRIGNVTTPAGYKLYVETGILTEKVKVAVKSSINWADYVFATDYKLMPLEEVEAFILSNKHLPGLSSTAELQKDGLDLGAMQAKQMEKIEELTLYLIQMKKELDQLKMENAALKSSASSFKN